jgi:hypothetical protein
MSPIVVTISPTAASTTIARPTVKFSATVAGDTKGVNWSADKGTIDSFGLFTAPEVGTPGPAKVTATSKGTPVASSFALVALASKPATKGELLVEARALLDNTVRELQTLASRDLLNPTNTNNVLNRLKKSIADFDDKVVAADADTAALTPPSKEAPAPAADDTKKDDNAK